MLDPTPVKRLPFVADAHRSKGEIVVVYTDGSCARITTRKGSVASQIATTERRLKVLRALKEDDDG